MAFDYKKAYKEFYLPPRQPQLIAIPPLQFLAVKGKGDPNTENGTYKQSIDLLYGMAYTIKMSRLTGKTPPGYFDFVVPPLEGLWWQEDAKKISYIHKENFQWISMIRLPEFVTEETFRWAQQEAAAKKGRDFSPVLFFTWEEGVCVQCMHIGPFDTESSTLLAMENYAKAQGYEQDLGMSRYHHEIYLSDVRRCKAENWKTVIRLPVKKKTP